MVKIFDEEYYEQPPQIRHWPVQDVNCEWVKILNVRFENVVYERVYDPLIKQNNKLINPDVRAQLATAGKGAYWRIIGRFHPHPEAITVKNPEGRLFHWEKAELVTKQEAEVAAQQQLAIRATK